jgi:hypothetical protein
MTNFEDMKHGITPKMMQRIIYWDDNGEIIGMSFCNDHCPQKQFNTAKVDGCDEDCRKHIEEWLKAEKGGEQA